MKTTYLSSPQSPQGIPLINYYRIREWGNSHDCQSANKGRVMIFARQPLPHCGRVVTQVPCDFSFFFDRHGCNPCYQHASAIGGSVLVSRIDLVVGKNPSSSG